MLKEVYFQMPYEVVKEPECKTTKTKTTCYKCTDLKQKKTHFQQKLSFMTYFVNDMYKSIFSRYIWLDNLSSSINKHLKQQFIYVTVMQNTIVQLTGNFVALNFPSVKFRNIWQMGNFIWSLLFILTNFSLVNK